MHPPFTATLGGQHSWTTQLDNTVGQRIRPNCSSERYRLAQSLLLAHGQVNLYMMGVLTQP